MFRRTLVVSLLLASASASGLGGCAHTRHPVPIDLIESAEIPGMPGVRDWAHERSRAFQKSVTESFAQEPPGAYVTGPGGERTYHMLALSGGGPDGAYGAGILNGWSAAGTRPKFKLITGISTGALIATFAFLGEAYDDELKAAYTTTDTRRIFRRHAFISWLWEDSLTDSMPLAKMIEQYITDDMIRAVAVEHAKGRRLFVATTNLDADRLVVWDMGAIAGRDTREAFALYRDVVRASASVPIVFTPVYITVKAGGQTYDEMHVDAGAKASVFVRGFMIDTGEAFKDTGVEASKIRFKLYIIRNGKLATAPSSVEAGIGAIARKTLVSMLNARTVGDLYRIYLIAAQQGAEFHFAALPPDYQPTKEDPEPFDVEEMTREFNLGYQQARDGYPWQTLPPGLAEKDRIRPRR